MRARLGSALALLLWALPARSPRTAAGQAAAAATLQFWHSMYGDKGTLLQELADEFNSAPANRGRVRVELQFVGNYEEALNKLRTALLAGRGPHIVQVTDIGTQVMADSGAVDPLQDFIDRDPSFPLKEILPQIRRYYEIGGRLWSLPFATSNPILFYNADAFAKAGLTRPPATFAELAAFSRRLTDPTAKTTGITWPLHSWFFEQLLARQGIPLADHNNGRSGPAGKVNFTAPEAFSVVSLWSGMIKEGTFANVGRGWEPAEQNFLAGRSAMLITSTSDVFEIIRKAPFKVATAPLPARDPAVHGGTVVGGNSLWILKDKPEPERRAAYEFLKFLASAPSQRRWHTGTGYFPIRSDVIAELEKEGFYRSHPAAKTAIDQLRASVDMPATRGALLGAFSEAREYVESALELILAGYATPEEALPWAKSRTEEALARYNRSLSPR